MMALSAQGLQVSIGAVPILRGLDVSFEAGRWTAIVGPNGAGKSTLLKALAGLMPAQGSIHLLGQPISKLNSKEKAQQLAWLGQSVSSVAEGMTVYDTAMLGRLPHQGWLDLPSHADHAAVVQALHETQCWDWRERQLSSLSGGERQRVLLARVLAVQARVVLMDEPLVNLDPPHQADWVNTVRALTAQGTTVVSVLHEVNVALLADHLLVIADGQVVHAGRCKEQDAHIALETVFKHRIKVVELQSQFQAYLNVSI